MTTPRDNLISWLRDAYPLTIRMRPPTKASRIW